MHTLCQTAALLLHNIPDSSLCLVPDLIGMASDLAVLDASGVLEQQRPRRSSHGDMLVPNDPPTVDMALFEGTCEQVNVQVETVRIDSVETLLCLKASVLLILRHLADLRRERRLGYNPGTVLDEHDTHLFTTPDPDLHFGLKDDEDARAFLVALRQVLLTSPTSAPRRTVLSQQARQTATELLVRLQADLERRGTHSLALMEEVALLVAAAVCVHFQQTTNPLHGTGMDPNLLSDLIHCSIFDPPTVPVCTPLFEFSVPIRSSVTEKLCEAVRSQARRSVDAPPPGRLEKAVLRTLHAIVLQLRKVCPRSDHARENHRDQVCLCSNFQAFFSSDVVRALFRLVTIPGLAEHAVWILSDLIFPCGVVQSRLEEVAEQCIHLAREGNGELEHRHTNEADNLSVPSKPNCTAVNEVDANDAGSLNGPMNKRRKIEHLEESSDHFRVAGDELLAHILLAMRRASILDSLLVEESSSGLQSLKNEVVYASVLHDATIVSSAFQLMLTTFYKAKFSQNRSIVNIPRTWEVINVFSKTIASLCSVLTATIDSQVEDKVLFIAEVILANIVFINSKDESCDVLDKADVDVVRPIYTEAKQLFELLSTRKHEGKQPDFLLPVYLQEAAFASHLRQNQSHLVRFFDQIFYNITPAGTCVDPFLTRWIGVENTPVHSSTADQVKRLKILSRLLGKPWSVQEQQISLEQHSLVIFTSFDPSSANAPVRLLLWQSVGWMFVASDPRHFRQMLKASCPSSTEPLNPDQTIGRRIIRFLIDVSFADSDEFVRTYAARELGHVLSGKSGVNLLAALASEVDWLHLNAVLPTLSLPGVTLRPFFENLIQSFFEIVDSALHTNCLVPQSQLSHTVTSFNVQPLLSSNADSFALVARCRRAAAQSLCSLCCSQMSPAGPMFAENAAIRVVRLWTGTAQRFESSATCYTELSRLSFDTNFVSLLQGNLLSSFAPSLFRDTLVPSPSLLAVGDREHADMPNSLIEYQFQLLSTFLRTFLVRKRHASSIDEDETDSERILNSCLPYVISQLVVEKDYEALQVTAGYKLFLLGEKRQDHKSRKRSETAYLKKNPASLQLVGSRFELSSPKSPSNRHWSRNLKDQTRQLCLAPGLVEMLIPLVFIKAGRSELIFFTKDVLHNKITLRQLIQSREMLTLKNFVVELGRNVDAIGSVIRGMKTAAIARANDPSTFDAGSGSSLASVCGSDHADNTDAITSWVSAHFMYLLVNVVQYKWAMKSTVQRIQVLQSLLSILDFLRPSESSQYMPQVMASVNAALVGAEGKNADAQRYQLASLAVKVLAKFTKLVAQNQWEVLGQNLTSVVVSLVPILSDNVHEQSQLDCQRNAVSLLEWLTEGELGQKLASYFSDIPFLPPCTALDKVRSSLRLLGVNFDDLQVVSTQTAPYEGMLPSNTSDVASTSNDSIGFSSCTAVDLAKQSALRRRLETVCSLLDNENVSVRRVVLDHLTALLRSNRDIFHGLVESESTTSTKSFVTVAYRGKGGTLTQLRNAAITFSVVSHTVYALRRIFTRSNYGNNRQTAVPLCQRE
jgi:hypothetical protein